MPLRFAFFARYQAALDKGMRENEFVYVYFGRLAGPPRPAPVEVSAVEFAGAGEIETRIARKPQAFTVWLRHYFDHHGRQIARCAERTARTPRQSAGRLPARRR